MNNVTIREDNYGNITNIGLKKIKFSPVQLNAVKESLALSTRYTFAYHEFPSGWISRTPAELINKVSNIVNWSLNEIMKRHGNHIDLQRLKQTRLYRR